MFAAKDFKKGEPLLFYMVELLTADEGRDREEVYTDSDGNFIYLFTHNGNNW